MISIKQFFPPSIHFSLCPQKFRTLPSSFSLVSLGVVKREKQMFGFGDELVLRSFKIPWLIWIQILVMFLLTLVIFISYFEFFDLDSSLTSGSISSASSPCPRHPLTCSASTQGPTLKEREQVAGNHNASIEIGTSTSNRTRPAENNSDTDDSYLEELTPTSISERFCHPCRYFDLAKEAFLKCLGLGSSSQQDSPPRQQRHQD